MECLKGPGGKVITTKGKRLAEALRAEGWQDTEPPAKEPKQSRSKRKGYYYTDYSFRNGY